jgi:hypothetical protein
MDLSETNWWSRRRLKYNIMLVVAGLTAFLAMALVGDRFCTADRDFEITVFTIAFQSVGYLIAMAIANVFYGLGPLCEHLFKQRNLTLYRYAAFSTGVVVSVALPLLVPLGLFLKCTL